MVGSGSTKKPRSWPPEGIKKLTGVIPVYRVVTATSKEEMAYRFNPSKKVMPTPVTLDTKSAADFPALKATVISVAPGAGAKMDFKKVASTTSVAPVQAINKIAAQPTKIKPSSKVVTHCYDEFGEDYDGPDEYEIQAEADAYEFNAHLPTGGRRGGF